MTLDINIAIYIISSAVTIGVIYGTIKSNDKQQAEQIRNMSCKLDKIDDEQKERMKEFREEMNAKFEKYNGLRERMAVGERDLKTLWNKFDNLERKDK